MGLLIIANVAMAPLGGLLALLVTGTHIAFVGRRLSRAVRCFRRRSDHAGVHQSASFTRTFILDAAIDGSVRRLRPIMMTMLVASVGLLRGNVTGIGSDSQRLSRL